MESNPRQCACGCGKPIPKYYSKTAQYLRGHQDKAQPPKVDRVAVARPEPNPRHLTRRGKKEPNWNRLFKGLDKMTTRLGVPAKTWEMDRDEVKELNEAWAELLENADEAEWLAKVMNVLGLVLFILTIGMIFAPRVIVTYQVLMQGKEVGTDGRPAVDRPGGMDGSDQSPSPSSGNGYPSLSGPWS